MKKALIGYGGHAREVMAQMGTIIPCFVDDEYVNEHTLPISSFNPEEYMLMVAVSNPQDRLSLVNRLPKNTKFFTWIHPNAHLLDNNISIGEGSFIGVNTILTTNIEIGCHAILNRSNHVGHDCKIGDFFSMMPGSIVSGEVNIGNLVYMGNNSSVREKINVSDSVTIGMNSAVVKDIIEKGVFAGVPAKKIK